MRGKLVYSAASWGVLASIRAPAGPLAAPPRYRCPGGAALPSAPGLPNSPWAMPIFSSTHSMASICPVVTATWGRWLASPLLLLRGKRVGLFGKLAAKLLVVQAVVAARCCVIARRNLPA